MGRDHQLESLDVFILAEQLADAVWEVASRWPNFARDTIGKQLVRAADSVGANIAEGYGRFTYKDRRHYLHVARGSLYETRYWLRRAYRRSLLTGTQQKKLGKLLEGLPPKLNGFLRSIGRSNGPE
jgi:four helix bundle protein